MCIHKKITALLLALGASVAFAHPNCLITILNEKLNGERLRMTFQNSLHSENECAALADLHRHTAQSEEIRKRTVSYRWFGPLTSAKELARSHRKHRH